MKVSFTRCILQVAYFSADSGLHSWNTTEIENETK